MEAPSTASLPTTLRSPPALDAYTSLAEHESRTPASFFEGPPVLYYHRTGARAYVGRDNQDKLPWGGSAAAAAPAPAGDDSAWPVMGDSVVGHVVDVFVGSDTFTLYSPAAGCGVALPYPVIGLHAIKSAYTADNRRVPTIYMQLELSGSGGDADEFDTVELTVVPAGAAAAAASEEAADDAQAARPVSEASKLFDAISACADLHPDRVGEDGDEDGDAYPSFFRQGDENGGGDDYGDDEYDDGDDDDDEILVEGGAAGAGAGESGVATLEPIEGFRGVFRGGAGTRTGSSSGSGRGGPGARVPSAAAGLPPPMPGSGGWITADNAHEFFDEEGNWRGRGAGAGRLGEGAGRVRGRDEVEAGEAPLRESQTEEAASASGPLGAAAAAAAPTSPSGAANPNGHDGAANGDETESKRLRTE